MAEAFPVFFLKSFFSGFLSNPFRVSKRYPGGGNAPLGRCSSCYPCSASMGSAQLDSCGHSQETSAPNLQIGPCPAQVRLRARAVSNLLGGSLASLEMLSGASAP